MELLLGISNRQLLLLSISQAVCDEISRRHRRVSCIAINATILNHRMHSTCRQTDTTRYFSKYMSYVISSEHYMSGFEGKENG